MNLGGNPIDESSIYYYQKENRKKVHPELFKIFLPDE
jgi:hypothetical protein